MVCIPVRFVAFALPDTFYLTQLPQETVYPSKLKHAKVIPVYKDHDETNLANYRPVSLLSNVNRTFEKIMFNPLKAFIAKNEILYRSQYGFRDKHSTQHAILDIVNSIQRNMGNKLFSCVFSST